MTGYAPRPPFRTDGRVVARREIKLGKIYSAGQDLPVEREGVTPRQIAMWWDQGLIDTLDPAPVPAAKPVPPQQNNQHRR